MRSQPQRPSVQPPLCTAEGLRAGTCANQARGSLPQAPRAEPPTPPHEPRVALLGAAECRLQSPFMFDPSLARSPASVHQRAAASRRRRRAHRSALPIKRPGRLCCPPPLCRTLRLALAMNADRKQAPGCGPKAAAERWKGWRTHSHSGCGKRGDEGPTSLPLPGCEVYRQNAPQVCYLALYWQVGSCAGRPGRSGCTGGGACLVPLAAQRGKPRGGAALCNACVSLQLPRRCF